MPVIDAAKKFVKRKFDAWENAVSRLGTVYDKLTYHLIQDDPWIDEQSLEALFYNDWLAGRIIQEPIDAAFRPGYRLLPPADMDPEEKNRQMDEVGRVLESIGFDDKYMLSLYWGRLYGRGALLIGTDDSSADMSQPFELSRVSELHYVEDLSVDEFRAKEYQSDPTSRGFGEPETWNVTRSGGTSSESTEVHGSRLVISGAVPTSRKKRQENNWRDCPVLQRVYDSVRNYSSGMMGIAHMMTDSSQAVLSIDGFIDALAEHGTVEFENRMRILDLSRALRIMPIDAREEKFEYVERTFTGVADLLDKIALDVSGAAKMPMTILFGRSPAGLNATGESDITGWYDQVDAERTKDYLPGLVRVVQIAAQVSGSDRPEEWSAEFLPLWQESDKDRASREKTIAETDKINIDAGVYTEDEVAIHRYGGESFDDSPVKLSAEGVEARTIMLEMDLEKAKEKPEETEEGAPQEEESEAEEGIDRENLPDDGDTDPEDDEIR